MRNWLLERPATSVKKIMLKFKGSLAGCVDLVGLTVVDLVWRHQADASMVVILIIPIEEAAAEGLRILDAAEPLRKLGLASRGELSPSALSDPSVRLSPHSAPIK